MGTFTIAATLQSVQGFAYGLTNTTLFDPGVTVPVGYEPLMSIVALAAPIVVHLVVGRVHWRGKRRRLPRPAADSRGHRDAGNRDLRPDVAGPCTQHPRVGGRHTPERNSIAATHDLGRCLMAENVTYSLSVNGEPRTVTADSGLPLL